MGLFLYGCCGLVMARGDGISNTSVHVSCGFVNLLNSLSLCIPLPVRLGSLCVVAKTFITAWYSDTLLI